MRHYAEGRGLVLHAIYADAGVSGVTLERFALQQLLADCRAGTIGTVVTQDPERLSRDKGQQLALLHILAKAGVRVEYSTGEDQDSHRLLQTMLSAVAAHERAKARSNASKQS
jgi:DNA invertase Pin-like site-specific DNA recombinase